MLFFDFFKTHNPLFNLLVFRWLFKGFKCLEMHLKCLLISSNASVFGIRVVFIHYVTHVQIE